MIFFHPRFLGGACVAALLGSCAQYRAQPIDVQAVQQAWQQRGAHRATTQVQPQHHSPQPYDLTDGISLAEAETTALFFNPSIRATRLQLGIPTAEAQHAQLWEDPELEIDGARILESAVDKPWILGSSLSFSIPLSGRLQARKHLAEARTSAQEEAILGAEWALLSNVRQTWAQLAIQDLRIARQGAAIQELQSVIAISPQLKAAQAMTVVDERLLLIQQKLIENELQNSQTQQTQQRLLLLSYLGLHPEHNWTFEQASIPEQTATEQPILLNNPNMRIMLAAYQVAERQLELEVRKQYPDLRIGLGLGSEENETRALFGLGLLPLPVWNSNKQGIATSTVERTVAGAAIETALQELTYTYISAQEKVQDTQQQLTFLTEHIVPLVQQQIADAHSLASLGQLDVFILVDALQRSYEVEMKRLETLAHLVNAQLTLDALQGPPAVQANTPVQ